MKDFKHYLSIVNESVYWNKKSKTIESALNEIGVTGQLAYKIEKQMKQDYLNDEKYSAKKETSFIFYTKGNQKQKTEYEKAKSDLAMEVSDDPYLSWEDGEVKVDGKTYVFAYLYNVLKTQGLPPRLQNMYDTETEFDDRNKYM
jgi:hypothetical protein